jgi:hypothetical protein
MICQKCEHPGDVHKKDGCRVTGCECPGFDGPPAPPEPTKPRRVTVDVPDGYTLSITLIPVETADD